MSPSNRSLTASVLYDATDQRVRATWRILIPILVATLIYITGLLGLQQLVGEHAVVVGAGGILLLTIATIAALLMAARLDKRPVAAYGFERSRRWGRDCCGGVGIGLIASSSMMAFGVAAGQFTSSVEVTGVGAESLAVGGGVVVLLVGFVLANNVFEEVLFRGIVMKNATEALGSRFSGVGVVVGGAVGVSVVLFGLFHLFGGGLALVITSAIAGLFFVAGYLLTGQLALPIGVHFGGIITYSMQQEPLFGGFTFPSVIVVEPTPDPSLLIALGMQFFRVLVGVALLAAWVFVFYGGLSIDDRVYTNSRQD